jgi:hypothetical protein
MSEWAESKMGKQRLNLIQNLWKALSTHNVGGKTGKRILPQCQFNMWWCVLIYLSAVITSINALRRFRIRVVDFHQKLESCKVFPESMGLLLGFRWKTNPEMLPQTLPLPLHFNGYTWVLSVSFFKILMFFNFYRLETNNETWCFAKSTMKHQEKSDLPGLNWLWLSWQVRICRFFDRIHRSLPVLLTKVETPIHDNDLILTPRIAPQSGWQWTWSCPEFHMGGFRDGGWQFLTFGRCH